MFICQFLAGNNFMLQLKNLADSLPASFCPAEIVLDGLYFKISNTSKSRDSLDTRVAIAEADHFLSLN
jgi:hypothetical protein